MEYLSGAYSDVEPTDPTYNDDAQSLGDGTAGGDWGDIANMPVNLSTLTGTEDIDNSDVNISVSGTTIGLDGGGTTTYTLDQTNVGLSGVQNDADQTSANTAAGIAGQGALATANEVSWTSEVTSRPTELTDGRVSTGLDSDGNLISSVNGTPASIVGQSTGGAWRNGFEDGSEFSGWTAPTGHTLTRETSEVFSGSSSARIVTATQSSSAAGTTGAVYFAIPEEIALSFGGRKILITCYAKAATSSGASSFQIAYSTNEVGNSGFSSFTPTTSWQVFAFTYDVPDPVNGGTDFIGIQGDGSSGVLYVDNVAVMALMNDDEINLSGVPNALQYSGGGTFTGDLASTRNTGALADADTVNLASTGAGGVTGLLPTGNAATGLRNSNVNYASDGTGELPENRGGTGLTSTYTLRNTNVLSDDFSHGSTTQYLSRWTAANDTGGEETIVTDTNSPQGSYVLQIGDNSAGGDDEVWRSLPMADAIPIEENAIYKLRAIAARTAGSGTIYFGINGVNAAKTAWVRRDGSTSSTHMGSAHYIAASGHSPSDTAYHEYVGYFYRNATDGQLHANALNANTNTLDNVARIDHAAEYAVPLFIANYNNAPGTVKIAFIELSKVVGFGADSEIFLNSSITINPNGLIVGAGGGQVTIGGLGYTGDMAATRNTGALADADTVNLATTGAGGVTGLLPTGNAATGLRNSGITINANGSISGAGGGQVTIGGLGYTGHLNATRNTGALADEDTVNLATTGAGGVSGLLPSGNASTGLRNSSISISSNGTLNNAGGGSVNLNGLGFTGDTDATNGAVAGTNFTSGYRPGDTEILASTASTLVNASAGWTQLADSFQLNGSGSVTVEYDRYSQASAINGHAPVQIQFRQGSTVLYTLSSIYGNSTWINNNEVNITLNNVTDPIDVFVRAQQSGQSGGVRNVSIKAGAIANGEAIV